jgi:hypothetical protein
MGEMRNAYKILDAKRERTDDFRSLSLDERIILKWVLKKHAERCGLDPSGS